jgi:hypothetical protein
VIDDTRTQIIGFGHWLFAIHHLCWSRHRSMASRYVTRAQFRLRKGLNAADCSVGVSSSDPQNQVQQIEGSRRTELNKMVPKE